jgi:diguanylate cyclase (GGDEF)-like protein
MMNTGPALDFQGIAGDFTSFADALVVPIIYEDEALGTISLYAQEANSYTQHELGVAQTLAGFLSPLIADVKRHGATGSEDFVDPTTQIHRISYLTAIGPQLIAHAGKSRTPVSLIYIGIRNLLQIMRIYGEPMGNSIVKRIADSIKPELRETDILVRYGQQGFVAFLPGVRADQAKHAVKRLRQQIKTQALTLSSQNVPIDCRFGVSSYPVDGTTIFALLQSAQEDKGDADPEIPFDSNVVDFPPRV